MIRYKDPINFSCKKNMHNCALHMMHSICNKAKIHLLYKSNLNFFAWKLIIVVRFEVRIGLKKEKTGEEENDEGSLSNKLLKVHMEYWNSCQMKSRRWINSTLQMMTNKGRVMYEFEFWTWYTNHSWKYRIQV